MKFNVVNNKEGDRVLPVSGQCVVAQARSALLASSQSALYSVSRRPLSSFGLWIILFILLPLSLPLFIFSTDKSVWQVPGAISVGAHGWKARVYQGIICSRRSVSRVRCSDGGERVKSYAEETREKNEGRVGRVLSLFPLWSLPFFFPRQFLERALLSERLEQANQGLALPKLETPGQTRHPPPLSDAVVKERWNIS